MKPLFKIKLYQAIFIPIIGLMMTALVLLALNGYYRTHIAATTLTESILKQEANLLSQTIENQFNQTDRSLLTLSKMIQGLSYKDNQDWLAFQLTQWSQAQQLPIWLITPNQGSFHAQTKPFNLIETRDASGKTLSTYTNTKHQTFANTNRPKPLSPIWKSLLQKLQTHTFAWQKDAENFYIAYAVPDNQGQSLLIGTQLKYSQLSKMLEKVMIKLNHPTFYILDANQHTLLSSPLAKDYATLSKTQDTPYVLITNPLKLNHNTHWQLVLKIPKSELVAPINRNLQSTLWQTLLVLAAITFIIFILAYRAGKPLQQLKKNAQLLKTRRYQDMVPMHTVVSEYKAIDTDLQALKIRYEAIERYVPYSLIEALNQSKNALKVQGDLKQLSMLNLNIPKFSRITADFTPHQMVHFLSLYQTLVYDSVHHKMGIIDLFKGSQIFAYWGAPLAKEQDIFNTCQTALQINKQLIEVNENLLNDGYPPINTHISIYQGTATVGNFGSTDRMVYTAVSGQIDEAQSLTDYNTQYGTQIIICERTYQQIKETFFTRQLDVISTRYYPDGLAIYELIAWKTDPHISTLTPFVSAYEKALHLRLNNELEAAEKAFLKLSEEQPNDEALTYQLGIIYQLKQMR